MPFEQELDIYLRSRFTLMILVTPEEERALQSVKVVCDRDYLLEPAKILYQQ